MKCKLVLSVIALFDVILLSFELEFELLAFVAKDITGLFPLAPLNLVYSTDRKRGVPYFYVKIMNK